MLSQWTGKDTEHSWKKLISAFKDANEELCVAANDLEIALTHLVNP